MTVLCWNVEGLTLAKTTCDDFVSLITKYDIICITESWTSKSSQVELSGYKTLVHSYRRAVHRRAKRAGGGVIIYIKEDIYRGVKLVKNELDCIVWLKLDKFYFGQNDDIYLGIAYIVPENSPIHALYNTDLFQTLEEDIMFFSDKGCVFLAGDLNARSSNKRDYVDLLNGRSNETHATGSIPLPRVSQDKGVNRFGDLLLDVCKYTDMRIVNGRLHNDAHVGSFTCMTANGESLVDYLLTSHENYNLIQDFTVLPFNEFSNHAPLSFSFRTQVRGTNQRDKTPEGHSVRWNDEKRELFRARLSERVPVCIYAVEELQDTNSQENINRITSIITDCITSADDTLFNKKHATCNKSVFKQHHRAATDRAAWYDKECKTKKSIINKCLDTYNRSKTAQNRKVVLKARKDYKYFCRKRKQRFQRERCLKMDDMRRNNPKGFWKYFKKKPNSSSGKNNVSLEQFFEYFKDLASSNNQIVDEDVEHFLRDFDNEHDHNGGGSKFEGLDEHISQEEIVRCIKQLSRNKSPGKDNLLNEYFVESIELLIVPLEILFNNVLDSGCFPSQWTEGIIVPLHKKGPEDDPKNYRGITLISCLGKLFTSVINQRIINWSTANEISTDAQFGFKAGHSTIDAIFVLQNLIQRSFKNKKRLYCAFIDLQRAFDSVYRNALWYKLIKYGIDGKLLKLLRSMYNSVKSCVRHINSLSDFFSTDIGLFQGEILSPILFSFFLNVIEQYLQENIFDDITLDRISIYLLLFADDAVLISDSKEGLQRSLNQFENYFKKWNLTINISKTKVMICSKGGRLPDEHFTLNGEELELVGEFNYLGFLITSGGSVQKAINLLADKAVRSMGMLFSIIKHIQIPFKMLMQLFDTYVKSILN